MKNICFFNTVTFWGGGEKLHLDHAVAFKEKGYTVCIVSHKHSQLSVKAKEQSIPVFNMSGGNMSFLNPLKIAVLHSFFKRNSIDTVVFSTSHDCKLAGIAAKIAGVKRIVYLRGLAVEIKKTFLNSFLLRDVCSHIIANSQETKRTIYKNFQSVFTSDKIQVVYHGIETFEHKHCNTLPEIADKKHGLVLGNAGRLTAQKGQLELIDIALKLKTLGVDFSLFIAGTGELEQELNQLISKNNLQNNVFLLGFVQDMNSFMHSIDVFLLTSQWEGFGYVLVEAMYASKPVVAYHITSNPEIVDDTVTGFLVDNKNNTQFAEKIAFLNENNIIREAMGKAGYGRVKSKFNSIDKINEFEIAISR